MTRDRKTKVSVSKYLISKLATERMSSLQRGCNHVHVYLISLCTYSSQSILDRHECLTGKYTTYFPYILTSEAYAIPAFHGCLSEQLVKNGEKVCVYEKKIKLGLKDVNFIFSC